jgi:hypothetical protein
MNFYANRLKKYSMVLDIFKFFWEHSSKNDIFCDFWWDPYLIKDTFTCPEIFNCEYILGWSITHKKMRSNEWTFEGLSNTAKGMTKWTFFGILYIYIFHERIVSESWN